MMRRCFSVCTRVQNELRKKSRGPLFPKSNNDFTKSRESSKLGTRKPSKRSDDSKHSGDGDKGTSRSRNGSGNGSRWQNSSSRSSRSPPTVRPFRNFQEGAETPFTKSIAVNSEGLSYRAVDVPDQPAVPILAHNLDRVLFSPGVHVLRDPRTNVYNFTPYLENIMSIKDFDFNAVAAYVPSGKDQTLAKIAKANNKKYTGSTSSLTGILSQFHFLLSHERPPHTMYLSKFFPGTTTTFTETQRKPVSTFLRYNPNTDTHAVDSDGSLSDDIIVSILGHQLEAMLTTPEIEFERFRKNPSSAPSSVQSPAPSAPSTYNYTECGSFLMRSQLDCYDPRLPGTGFFDLKTRAVCAVRHDMDYAQIHDGSHYQVTKLDGEFESFAREWYELIRSTMLKYSLQARIGRMDGIFVAYHNIRQMFGFQYVPLSEMDRIFHTSHLVRGRDRESRNSISSDDYVQIDDAMAECASLIADTEFMLSVQLMSKVFDRIVSVHPDKTSSFNVVFHTYEPGKMHIFVKPMLDADIAVIQSRGSESWDDVGKQNKKENDEEFCDPNTIWQHAKKNLETMAPDTKVYTLDIRTYINNQLIQPSENPTIKSPKDVWQVQAVLGELRANGALDVFKDTFGRYNFDENRITSSPLTSRLGDEDEAALIAASLEKLAPPTTRQELMRVLGEKGKQLQKEWDEKHGSKEKVVWFPKPIERVCK